MSAAISACARGHQWAPAFGIAGNCCYEYVSMPLATYMSLVVVPHS